MATVSDGEDETINDIVPLEKFLTAAQQDFQIVRGDGWNIFCWAAQKL
eukprot:CAMPEP_0117750424 /NCGR_PEP_ID=MMETSP0947-20121206/10365_1 /TAXON_ID=44440 /ORGANISM="Chattonella subsalsa, Strain CCMP2191" /LENGTH=47 /DNA_ID= /DNA_START= /DNA_END= /DNA_ORIENTATION=